ncbi:MAG: GGDEF domain-containing protein [Planctomycetales bacterium]|nr:GGDEF domain-containing protein [Planctomycetales bacterium]
MALGVPRALASLPRALTRGLPRAWSRGLSRALRRALRRGRGPLGLSLPPAAGVGAAFLFTSGPRLPALAGTLLALALLALAGAVLLEWRDSLRAAAARRREEDLSAAQQEAAALSTEVRRLQREVDVLAAAREIGLVVNADNEFREVLEKVLRVVEDLLRAEEVALFLRDRSSGALEAVARRASGRFEALPDLDGRRLDRTHVAEAMEGRRLLRVADGTRLALTLPLAVEHEVVGVLRTVLDIEGARPEERAAEAERALREIERHLALAIKAPSLYDRAVRDGLTGLYSRRHLDNQLAEFFAIARRTGKPISLVMVDLDHFKRVNDTHGHAAGDAVLRGAAEVVAGTIRGYDTAYRYGGEEICVLLPHASLEEAVKTAERIRRTLEKRVIHSNGGGECGAKISVTASLGVAQWSPRMGGPADLLSAADRALYKAKEGGRNRTVAAD